MHHVENKPDTVNFALKVKVVFNVLCRPRELKRALSFEDDLWVLNIPAEKMKQVTVDTTT
jgi:hypothetical protein